MHELALKPPAAKKSEKKTAFHHIAFKRAWQACCICMQYSEQVQYKYRNTLHLVLDNTNGVARRQSQIDRKLSPMASNTRFCFENAAKLYGFLVNFYLTSLWKQKAQS